MVAAACFKLMSCIRVPISIVEGRLFGTQAARSGAQGLHWFRQRFDVG